MTRFFAGWLIAFLLGLSILLAASGAHAETGLASWYGSESGSRRADGHHFNPNAVSCAHKTLPLGTWIKVIDLSTHRSIRCQVLDRGPYVRGRIVDLSRGGARRLGIIARGTVRVRIDRLR